MSMALAHAGDATGKRARRRHRGRSSTGLTTALLAVACLPPLSMYLGAATSMAAGVMAVCLAAIAVSLMQRPGAVIWPSPRGTAVLGLGAFICAHAFVVVLTGRMDLQRFVLSLVLLLVFLLGAMALGQLVFTARDRPLHRSLCFVLSLLALAGGLGLAGFAPHLGIEFAKPVFPFTEPSHFALSTLPFFLYYCVTSRGSVRLLALSAGLLAALTLQNLTMLSAVAVTILVCARPVLLALLAVPLLLAVPALDLQYFSARLDFSPESDNLSALVFVQGWQLIGESLTSSRFWGLGFQQLGVYGTQVEFADLINALVGEDFNLSDGGFGFSKLVSEFGLFGLVATAVHLYFAGRFAMRLRAVAHGPVKVARSSIFAHAVVVGFTVDLFIRGNGYFTASTLMYAAAWMHLASPRISTRRPESAPRVSHAR